MCDRHDSKTQGGGLSAFIERLFDGGDDAAMPATRQDAQDKPLPAAQPVRRRKLWELAEKYHCPVVGTCLNIDELRKIARKEGFSGKSFDSYRLHVEAVSASCARNSTAEAMHKLLERKYVRWVKVFDQAKTDEAVRKLWQTHLERGEVAGPMWAALTHKAASKETGDLIYGDVHMLSHQIGAGLAADARRMGYLEGEVNRLQNESRQHMYRTNQMLAERAVRIKYLEAENQRQANALQELPAWKARAEALESGQVMVDMGRRLLLLESANARLEGALQEMRVQADQLEQFTAENRRLRKELASRTAERDAMERLMLANLPAESSGGAGCDGDCDQCSEQLKGRCVLCVGGRTALLPQYRELAERLGIRLIHHDGGQEEAMSRLPDLLAASDAVICPTDCVSHMAYYQLKRYCKSFGKPCVLTKSSGVAGFAAALNRLAEGRVDIHPGS
jgi:hypothetical protein